MTTTAAGPRRPRYFTANNTTNTTKSKKNMTTTNCNDTSKNKNTNEMIGTKNSSRNGDTTSRIGSSVLVPNFKNLSDENHVYAESLLYLLNRSEQNESKSSLKAQASILRKILERDHNDSYVPHSTKLANNLQKRNPNLLKVWHAVHQASALHEKSKNTKIKIMRRRQKNLIVKTETVDTDSTSAVCSDEADHLLIDEDDDDNDDDLVVASSSYSNAIPTHGVSSINASSLSSSQSGAQQESIFDVLDYYQSERFMVDGSSILSNVAIKFDERREEAIEMFIL
jgi:hypothetical protein